MTTYYRSSGTNNGQNGYNNYPKHNRTVGLLIYITLPGPQQGGAKGGGAPLNENSAPLKCPACPPKLPIPLRQFQDGGFFCWKPTEN